MAAEYRAVEYRRVEIGEKVWLKHDRVHPRKNRNPDLHVHSPRNSLAVTCHSHNGGGDEHQH